MRNLLTIDLEDYYQVTAFHGGARSGEWDNKESHVEQNAEKVLEILSSAHCRATFFSLGWVAEKFPHIIRRIVECGHEIACHSNRHRLVYSMAPAEFEEDTRRAKELLEDAGGVAIRGYRAPSFSITRNSKWAFEVLARLGFTYDSSIFPVKHMDYGIFDAPRHPFKIATPSGTITEFPLPTITLGSARSPIAGGAYFRLLPYRYTRWGIRYLNAVEGQSVCVYLHPWEIDPAQPRLDGGFTARARQYFGLRGTEAKFRRLLTDFDFEPLGDLIQRLEATPLSQHELS